ncbi:MAG: hypothetical protein K0R34_1230 [Herbinix sp.]|jgi:hypothetical protein|nr:hypothetical protein [Herbinix sp.]
MINRKRIKTIITLAPPLLGILLLFLKEPILALTKYIPTCFLYSRLHLYCPACGNTRSVSALLHGDVIASLHYNITPGLVLLLGIIAYIELIATRFGRPIKLLPRKLWFYLVLITLLVIYYIARNISPVLTP